MTNDISVVLPVHAGVVPEHFKCALASLVDQTLLAVEVVVVEDGPLTPALRDLLSIFQDRLPLRRLKLGRNCGAGVANQIGLEAATSSWIAKADADDINMPSRFAVQLQAALEVGADVCGSAMLEFIGSPENVVSRRAMPLSHAQIGRRIRWNNPINHPTAFYRRDQAVAAGGYPVWRHMQDYGLFARMYADGAEMFNLAEPLVLFRSSDGVTRRRRSQSAIQLESALQSELYELGLIGGPRRVINVAWRTMFRRLPPSLVGVASRRVLARRADNVT